MDNPQPSEPVLVPQISVADALLRQQDQAIVLDVRNDDEYHAGHAPGSISIPLGDLPARHEELDKSQAIVVICRGGTRSQKAAELLTELGYCAVNTTGGMSAWEAAGNDVVRLDGTRGTIM